MDNYEQKHTKFVVETLAECTVLLKKDGHFPLNKPCKLAAYGNGIRGTIKGGTGSGEVNSHYVVNIEQGLISAGFEITTQKWLDDFEKERIKAREAFIKRMKAEAKAHHANVLIYAMGKPQDEPEHNLPLNGEGDSAIYVLSRISGEGNDRSFKKGDFFLTGSEKRDILACNEKYENFMLVLNVGGPIDLSELQEVKNILLMSQLGAESGTGLAQILLGKQNPSGKLSTTWAKKEEYVAMDDFEDPNETRYREGIYVGYRYFDTFKKEALYPFGYGLSYSDFVLGACKASINNENVSIEAKISNVSAVAGKEVLQVYVSCPWGRLDHPYQQLVGFVKSDVIKANQSTNVKVNFRLSELASYDTNHAQYILEKGNYIVRVGFNSRQTHPIAVVKLDEEVILANVMNVLGKTDFEDLRSEKPVDENPDGIPILTVNSNVFKTFVPDYQPDYPVDEKVTRMTIDELAKLGIGAFKGSGKLGDIIVSSDHHVAGVAGETACCVEGIPYLTMADGPAGLRLSRRYYRDEKGVHSIGESAIPQSVLEFLPKWLTPIANAIAGGSKEKAGVEVKQQNCTMIPIGTAVAQSFNLELVQQYGDLVGEEMERFDVNLWLAPALNIHRSILCGRNFEYYSEDPLLSGKMAAAITKGVQNHLGRAVTIKHYAANNKELKRYTNNSIVSERAMREIYLKGFELCVKEAQPKALMTSYNLLNGMHTAEQRGLIENILRCEFDFKGIVMSDWIIQLLADRKAKHRNTLAAYAAAAGGDLLMPGSMADYKNLTQGVIDGIVSRKQLEINATRIVKLAKELRKD